MCCYHKVNLFPKIFVLKQVREFYYYSSDKWLIDWVCDKILSIVVIKNNIWGEGIGYISIHIYISEKFVKRGFEEKCHTLIWIKVIVSKSEYKNLDIRIQGNHNNNSKYEKKFCKWWEISIEI